MSEKDDAEFPVKAGEHFREDRHRLVRWIVVESMIILLALVAMGVYGSYQLRLLKNQVNLATAAKMQIVKQEITPEQVEQIRLALVPKDGSNGKDGVNGKDGRDGADGMNGRNGESATPEQIASAVGTYLEANPDQFKGPQGDSGEAGATLVAFVRQNPLTSAWECRYSNNLFWQPLAECGG